MAVVGTWGGVVFSVSRGAVKTLENLKWTSGAKYAVHERHLRAPLLEFTGPETEGITFSVVLSAFLGVDPMAELGALLTAERAGKAERLVLGTHAYGTGRWVIEKLSVGLERFDATGELLHAKVDLTMKAYADR